MLKNFLNCKTCLGIILNAFLAEAEAGWGWDRDFPPLDQVERKKGMWCMFAEGSVLKKPLKDSQQLFNLNLI